MALVTEKDLNDTGRDRLIKMLQEKTPNYHPLIAMLEMAAEEHVEDVIRFNCHKEIAMYVEPKLKSVEHKGKVKADFGTLHVVRTSRPVPLLGENENKPGSALTNSTQEEMQFIPKDVKSIQRDLDEEIVQDDYVVNE